MTPKLFLFDIDGTLITGGGAGERALRQGIEDGFGIIDDLKTIEIAGRTDSGIARQIFTKHGIAQSAENFALFFESYLHQLGKTIPLCNGRLLPGVLPLLEALKTRGILALLTGNLERGAEIKLRHYGIWQYFEFGAFADDHHDRNQLGPFALTRATQRHGSEFSTDQVYVLGDTPHDITCARAIGAKVIAIATGLFTVDQLAEHAPDQLLHDLSDLPAVLKALEV